MQQFFIETPLKTGDVVTLSEEISQQLLRVLRYRGGEHVRLIDVDETPYLAAITVRAKRAEATVTKRLEEVREVCAPLRLALARIKRDKWEWALQKACELGVSAIVPLESARVNEKPFSPNRIVRFHRILEEAAEQSERHVVPALEEAQDLVTVLTHKAQVVVLAERHEDSPRLEAVLADFSPARPVLLIVGPEGGFTEEEFQAMEASGAHFASLGPRILRAETAALLAVGMTAQWMGEGV